MKHSWVGAASALVALLFAAAPTDAGRTETLLETSEGDFAQGEADGVVWTSLGTLRLGRALKSLLDETEGVDYVADLAEAPDGAIYAATGGAGRVYRLADGKVTLCATLPDKFLFSCAVDAGGVLYVGSGGTKGRIWRLAPQDKGEFKQEVFFEADDLKYVWDLVCLEDGSVAAATGDQGKLLRVKPDGKSEVLIDGEADHILCLAATPDGTLYAGTDGEAVVHRWAQGKSFILYDAAEAEVTALALDAEGNLYVGASSGAGGRGGGVEIPARTTIRIITPDAEGPGDVFSTETPEPNDKKPNDRATPLRDLRERESDPPEETQGDEAGETDVPAPKPIQSFAERMQQAMEAARQSGVGRPGPETPAGAGSRVCRITPEGIATPIFESSDQLILALAAAGDRLLIGTGNGAHIHEVALTGDGEEARLATMDPKQVTALVATGAGRVLVGTAGPGRLYALSKGATREGTYTSKVHDASGSARWGALEWRDRTPKGTNVRITTRAGNVGDPEKGMWSDWSKELSKSPARIESPAARYVQFRVTMRTKDEGVTPVLEQFEAAYLRANEPPTILMVGEQVSPQEDARAQAMERMRQMVGARNRANGNGPPPPPTPPPGPRGPRPVRTLIWQAQDPNGDTLTFDLYFRGQGEPKWILLEENLAQMQYPWDTSTVADGWYEIKVVASDRPDNPAETALEDSRVSDPILVDNTAPVIEKVETEVCGDEVTVRLVARDATSRIVAAAYTIDSSLDWPVIAPTDGLFDSLREEFRFTIRDLQKGPHRLAIRVSDVADNTARAARTLVLPE